MTFDWSTFLLEIVNFLILVWVLKRFLYKPVLNAIARRQADIEKKMAEAQATHAESQMLRQKYEGRLEEWGQERKQAHAALREELKAERDRLMASLQSDLAQERSKAQILEKRRLDELARQCEKTAVQQADLFISRVFTQLAGPEVEAKLVELCLDHLSRLSEAERRALQSAWEGMQEPIQILSAYPLAPQQKERLLKILQDLLGKGPAPAFAQEKSVIAGLRISAGPWVFEANLQDELKAFREAADHAG